MKTSSEEIREMKHRVQKDAEKTAESILEDARAGKKKILIETEGQLMHEKEKAIKALKGELAELIEKISEKVIHEKFGIKHGSMTTIHDITNTQSILDEYHPDLRRARASGLSLIPTTTGSATAITEIFPELKGKLNGIAVRVPLANASLTDCVFEVEQPVTVDEVNAALESAANGSLKSILGYETKPLVSADYTNDTHSSTIDALSTMVVNGTQVKLLAWYDNEIGYVHRMMELTKKLALSL